MSAKVIELVEHQVSKDAIHALETLLADAKDGKLIGIALIAMYRQREYIVDIAGETKRCPTFTRGMLCLLDEELANIIRSL